MTIATLSGLRVLEMTHVLSGPYSGYLFALLGAEVTKIEPPQRPDMARAMGPDEALNAQGRGLLYQSQGAGKTVYVLDLTTEEGRAEFTKLIGTADVLIENFREGVLARLGFDDEQLTALNPRLIHVAIRGFDRNDPRAEDGAYDNTIQAASGLMTLTAETQPVPAPVIDYATGLNAALAAMTALYTRERTGKGGRVDVAMQETALALMSASVTIRTGAAPDLPRVGAHAGLGTYDAADSPIVLGALSRPQWRGLADVLQAPELSSLSPRGGAARARIAALLKTRPADVWREALQAAGIPAEPVRTLSDVIDADIARGGFLKEMPGGFYRTDLPFRLNGARGADLAPPPAFGGSASSVKKFA